MSLRPPLPPSDGLSELTPRDRRLIELVLCVQLGRFDALERLRRAAPAGEPDRAWREALLQTHLFAGIPRVVEAWSVLERAGGLGDAQPDELAWEPSSAAEGEALFARIYGGHADEVRARLAGFHPVLERWILGHAYARTLSRPGLDAARRELLAVACLAALEQERQLSSHVRGALALGATAPALRALAVEAGRSLEPGARAVLERVLARELGSS